MVVNSSRTVSLSRDDALRSPAPMDTQSIQTQEAADSALKVVEAISDSDVSADKLDEFVLHVALRTCAHRATLIDTASQDESAQWASRWKLLRNYLVERNLGLVYSMVKRFRGRSAEWDDLRSEALLALVRAVEGFNPWWGYRFSTYACNAIWRAMVHTARKAAKRKGWFPIEYEHSPEEPRATDRWSELFADRLNLTLNSNLAELTERESLILGWRFPRNGDKKMTLGEVGKSMGLSKERVRQIQERALSKLRTVLEGDPLLQ